MSDENINSNQQPIPKKNVEDVIESYLASRGYFETLRHLKQEKSTGDSQNPQVQQQSAIDQSGCDEIFNFLLEQTANSADKVTAASSSSSNLLSSSPNIIEQYGKLKQFIHGSLDCYKHDWMPILYPVFLYTYLYLIQKNQTQDAQSFFKKYSLDHQVFHFEELNALQSITSREIMVSNPWTRRLLNLSASTNSKAIQKHFCVEMTGNSYELLLKHLHSEKFIQIALIINQFIEIKTKLFSSFLPSKNQKAHQVVKNHHKSPKITPSKTGKKTKKSHASKKRKRTLFEDAGDKTKMELDGTKKREGQQEIEEEESSISSSDEEEVSSSSSDEDEENEDDLLLKKEMFSCVSFPKKQESLKLDPKMLCEKEVEIKEKRRQQIEEKENKQKDKDGSAPEIVVTSTLNTDQSLSSSASVSGLKDGAIDSKFNHIQARIKTEMDNYEKKKKEYFGQDSLEPETNKVLFSPKKNVYTYKKMLTSCCFFTLFPTTGGGGNLSTSLPSTSVPAETKKGEKEKEKQSTTKRVFQQQQYDFENHCNVFKISPSGDKSIETVGNNALCLAAGFQSNDFQLYIRKTGITGPQNGLFPFDCVGHAAPVYGIDFSKENVANQWMLSGSGDGGVKLWNLRHLDCYENFDQLENDAERAKAIRRGNFEGEEDMEGLIGEEETAKLFKKFKNPIIKPIVHYKGHQFPVWDVAFSRYNYLFATASNDKTAKIFTTDRITPIRLLAGHLSSVETLCFHPNSNYLLTGSADKTLRLWDIHSGECVRIFIGHLSSIEKVCCSPNGKYAASSDENGEIVIWDLDSAQKLVHYKGFHEGKPVPALDFNLRSDLLCSGGIDGTVKIWDVECLENIKKKDSFSQSNIVDLSDGLDGKLSDGKTKDGMDVEKKGDNEKMEIDGEDGNKNSEDNEMGNSSQKTRSWKSSCLNTFFTKNTPVYDVKYLAKDVVLAGGLWTK